MNPASLHVVGLGPGDAACLTPQARTAIANASCVAGYSLYMELVPPELLRGKTVIGANSVIGGNSFITESIAPNTKASTETPRMIFRVAQPKPSDEK